jgi:arylsulfatase A-like enzyme
MKGQGKLKNLILVSYDSTRADVAYSGKFPGIERLRESGVTFKNCVSSAPLTPVSHASVMTGLQPYNHGIRHLFREQLDKSCHTIASVLTEHGYDTSAVVSCPGLHRWYEIGRGFTAYDDEIPLLPDGRDPLLTVDVKLRGQALKRADLVVERSRQQLEKTDAEKPFYHFIHFFDAHWPYGPPAEPFAVDVANPYEAEVAFLDHYFSQWFEWMHNSGRLADTLVVLFGDHGEDLNGWYANDKGGEEFDHPEEMGHGCLLYDQTVLVPLTFWHEGLKKAEIAEQVRLVDIFPTVMEMLGIEAQHKVDGISLANVLKGEGQVGERVGYSETFYPGEQTKATGGMFNWTHDKKAIRIDNRYKIIVHLDSDNVEAYDLTADPLETKNLLAP